MEDKTGLISANESSVANTKSQGDALSANNGSMIVKANNVILSPAQVYDLKCLMPASLSEAKREALATRYLDYLIDRYSFVQFKGMGINNLPLKIPLLDLYVPLRTRPHMPEGDCWTEELRLAGRKASQEEMAAIGSRVGCPNTIVSSIGRNIVFSCIG